MALQVEASLQQSQDALPLWHHRVFGAAASRADVLHPSSPLARAPTCLSTQPSRSWLRQPLSSSSHHPRPIVGDKSREPNPSPASRPFFSMPPARPPTLAVTPARRGKPSQYLPIASLLNPHTGVKRRRNSLDVDGPNTAAMSSKKRRLRRDLVTSRLSLPYSQPATHIYGRRDTRASVGRSVRTEATLGARPRFSNLHTTSFLRFSMMNRMRERLGLRWSGANRGGKQDAAASSGVGVTPQATWHQQRQRQEPGTKSVAPWPPSTGSTRRTISRRSDRLHSTREALPHPFSKTQVQPLTWTALPLASTKLAPIDRASSSLSAAPISSKARPPGNAHHDLCGDSVSSLHPDEDDAGDIAQETQDMFCGFGLLFSKGQPRSRASQDQPPQENVDGLDAFPWIAR